MPHVWKLAPWFAAQVVWLSLMQLSPQLKLHEYPVG
jgi:hypothetical protein